LTRTAYNTIKPSINTKQASKQNNQIYRRKKKEMFNLPVLAILTPSFLYSNVLQAAAAHKLMKKHEKGSSSTRAHAICINDRPRSRSEITNLGVLGLEVHGSGHMEDAGAAIDGLVEASCFVEVGLPERQVRFRLGQVQQMLHLLHVVCVNTKGTRKSRPSNSVKKNTSPLQTSSAYAKSGKLGNIDCAAARG